MLPFFLPLLRYVWLPAASFLAGVLNTIAGGGSFYDGGTYIPLEDYFENQPVTDPQTLASWLALGDPPDPVICYDI